MGNYSFLIMKKEVLVFEYFLLLMVAKSVSISLCNRSATGKFLHYLLVAFTHSTADYFAQFVDAAVGNTI